MTIEKSHGKARPNLVRASDLSPSEPPEAKPPVARTPDGRFAVGNRAAVDSRFTHAIRKSLGDKADTGEAGIVARDARRVFSNVIKTLSSDAAPVRALLMIYARHQALNAYYTLLAAAKGLDTPEGQKSQDMADRQSQRAERVLVTCHDLARVHAAQAKSRSADTIPWFATVDAEVEGETE